MHARPAVAFGGSAFVTNVRRIVRMLVVAWGQRTTIHRRGSVFSVLCDLDLLLTFDKHDRANVFMPALEEVVHTSNNEHPTKHGRGPIPGEQHQLCVPASSYQRLT